MEQFLDIFQQTWAIRALIASSLVGLMCGILGCFIVLRNMSLIGDALSHAILPGIFFSFLLFGYSTIGFFLGSAVAGLVTALAISWIQQNVDTKNDAAIGIIFTAMFSIGVIGISWISHKEGVHLDLDHFLFGNVLGVDTEDLILTSVVALYTVVSIILFYRYLFITTFQPTIAQTMGISTKLIHYFLMSLLSFAIVASLRTVGVILVVAMLITPASTALLLSNNLKRVIVYSGIIGVLSSVTGFLLAVLFNTTPGPAMTLTATLFYFLAVLFSPEKGLIYKMNLRRTERARIIREDILRQVIKKPLADGMNIHEIAKNLKLSLKLVSNFAKKMSRSSLLSNNKDHLILTKDGVRKAEKLVRAHRLWESYQVQQMGLDSSQIHDEADKLEHFLSEELVDEIDQELGYPTKDPHDSPIPLKPIS